jgi:flagellar basal body rod protein FlgG
MKKLAIITFIVLVLVPLFTVEHDLLEEYDMLLEDLEEYNSYGYKTVATGDSPGIHYYNRQGAIMGSSSKSNLAIDGRGFFKVYDPKRKRVYYTRNGSFQVSTKGNFILEEGYKLIPINANNKKLIAVKDIRVTSDNTVILYTPGSNRSLEKIEYKVPLYEPSPGSRVKRIGNYFMFEKAVQTSESRIVTGALEASTAQFFSVVSRLIFILNRIKHTSSNQARIREIDTKLLILEKMLMTEKKDRSELQALIGFLQRDYH